MAMSRRRSAVIDAYRKVLIERYGVSGARALIHEKLEKWLLLDEEMRRLESMGKTHADYLALVRGDDLGTLVVRLAEDDDDRAS